MFLAANAFVRHNGAAGPATGRLPPRCPMRLLTALTCAGAIAFSASVAWADEAEFSLTLRSRSEKDGKYEVAARAQTWPAKKTAVIVCDMWDAHHCLNAVRREEEMVPRMNEFLAKARQAA